jgi:D-amino-acid dehydrogenase
MKVIVIGAGIVGLATAWWLARDGHAVTVVDRETEVGRGTSFANGGQLSYSYVAPMASPSVLRGLPKYLLSPSSPIRFVPRADPAQWRWAFAFLRACTADASALATAQLLALSFHSRDSLAEMMADAPLEFDHRRNGKLVVMSSAASMAEAEAQMRLQANFGCEQRALTAAECLALEPGLESIADRLVGGIHTPSEEVGDCRKLCGSLRAVLAAPPFAVSFSLGRRVRQLRRHGDRIAALETDAGEMEADLYVLCAGPASAGLARDARIRVPVQPMRGYSISARVLDSNRAPVRSITDSARKTVYAPIGGALRVAGFAELGSDDTTIRPARIASLVGEVSNLFPGACALDDVKPWAGLRPVTPSSVPVIGMTRVSNLALNVGQGALGFTLAAGSGRLLADIVAGRPSAIDTDAYRPAQH